MKNLFILLFLFSLISANAQITLDQKVPGSLCNIVLSREGSKLYYFNENTRFLTILNLDNTVYKTISVPETEEESNGVMYVSDSLFNTDAKIEFAMNYYSYPDSTIIFNEDGIILFKSAGNLLFMPEFDFIFGESTKLVVKSNDSSWVYNLPGKYEPLNSSSNTQQNLELNKGILSISGGNSIDISTVNTDEQKLSLSNDTLYLSNGGYVYIGQEWVSNQKISLEANGLSSVYPNPATESLHVSYQFPNTEKNGTIELLNNQGIVEDEIRVYDNNGSIDLDLSTYKAGQYYVKLHTKNGYSSVKKAIIVK